MKEALTSLYNIIMDIVTNSAFYGPLLACLLIFLESMIPILPLFVFITIIFIAYGYIIGFILSYLLTILGCFFMFFICRHYLKNIFNKKILRFLFRQIKTLKNPKILIIIGIMLIIAYILSKYATKKLDIE